MADTPKTNTVKLTETPRQRFVRLAERRTSNVLDSLERLTPLANRSQYEYTETDVAKIKHAVETRLNLALASFRDGKVTGGGFSLEGGE